MFIYEYKLRASSEQYAAIDEAIRSVQFVRNCCVRRWMDTRGTSRNDLQCLCAVLAATYPFAASPELPGATSLDHPPSRAAV